MLAALLRSTCAALAVVTPLAARPAVTPPATFFQGSWAAEGSTGLRFYLRLRPDGTALMGSTGRGLAPQRYDLDPWITPPMIAFAQPDGTGVVQGRLWVVATDTIVLAVNVTGGPVPREQVRIRPTDPSFLLYTLVRVPEDRVEVTEAWIRLVAEGRGRPTSTTASAPPAAGPTRGPATVPFTPVPPRRPMIPAHPPERLAPGTARP